MRLPPAFSSIQARIWLLLLALIQIGILRYVYVRLGVKPGTVLLLLQGSLSGSYFNIPVANLLGEQILTQQEISDRGM